MRLCTPSVSDIFAAVFRKYLSCVFVLRGELAVATVVLATSFVGIVGVDVAASIALQRTDTEATMMCVQNVFYSYLVVMGMIDGMCSWDDYTIGRTSLYDAGPVAPTQPAKADE